MFLPIVFEISNAYYIYIYNVFMCVVGLNSYRRYNNKLKQSNFEYHILNTIISSFDLKNMLQVSFLVINYLEAMCFKRKKNEKRLNMRT